MSSTDHTVGPRDLCEVSIHRMPPLVLRKAQAFKHHWFQMAVTDYKGYHQLSCPSEKNMCTNNPNTTYPARSGI